MDDVHTPGLSSGTVTVRGMNTGRRGFLKMFAGGMAVAGVLAGCDTFSEADDESREGVVDLGSGDVGVLNYAYALEQLEAAFYVMVVDNMYGGATDDEKRVLKHLRDHEIAHREFLRTALGAAAIPALQVDFGAVDFDDRSSVLTTARTFEDLGVSAYNGAGPLLTNPDFLVAAGKIVSVEARHAAAIRDLIAPGASTAFAGDDVIDANGLDLINSPATVLAAASPFLKTRISGANLPGA